MTASARDTRPSGAPRDPAPDRTGSVTTRVIGAIVLAGAAVVAWYAFVLTPPDSIQRQAARLIYVHVPVVTIAYTACFVATVASAVWLWRRSQWWDLVASSAAEIAAVFTALTLATGMVWAEPTWGHYWVWDPRLTSTAMLLLLLLGYQALRRIPSSREARARRCAVVGLLLVPNVFVVSKSVEWWRSLHQDATLKRFDPKISDLMQFTVSLGSVVALLLFVWLMIHRFRVGYLADQADDAGLADALAERRAEAGVSGGEANGGGADGGPAAPAPQAPDSERVR